MLGCSLILLLTVFHTSTGFEEEDRKRVADALIVLENLNTDSQAAVMSGQEIKRKLCLPEKYRSIKESYNRVLGRDNRENELCGESHQRLMGSLDNRGLGVSIVPGKEYNLSTTNGESGEDDYTTFVFAQELDGGEDVIKEFLDTEGSILRQFPRDRPLNELSPEAMEAIQKLTTFLTYTPTTEGFYTKGFLAKDSPDINTEIFHIAYNRAIIERDDLKVKIIPPPVFIQPQMFISGYEEFVEELERNPYEAENRQIRANPELELDFLNPYSEKPLAPDDPESKLDYWREDIMFHSGHSVWRAIHEVVWSRKAIDKEARFYYTHQQFLHRYKAERRTANLPEIDPFIYDDWLDSVDGSYYPTMYYSALNGANLIAQQVGPRLPGCDMDRFLNLTAPGQNPVLDYQANVEAFFNKVLPTNNCSRKSENCVYIPLIDKNFHSLNHLNLAQCPANGAIGLLPMSARDPIFYRMHDTVNSVYKYFKHLYPRKVEEIKDDSLDVTVVDFRVFTLYDNYPDRLYTHYDFGYMPFNLTQGPKRQTFNVKYRRLNHLPFKYQIRIRQDKSQSQKVHYRIFLQQASQPSEKQHDSPIWSPFLERIPNENELIEMDSWVTTTSAENVFTLDRYPYESTIVMPQTSVKSVAELRKRLYGDPITNSAKDSFVACGLPINLLVPKGKPRGELFYMYLFVNKADCNSCDEENMAKNGHSGPWLYCGYQTSAYDETKKERGFPWDRTIEGCQDMRYCPLLSELRNVYRTTINIYHQPTKDDHYRG